MSTRCIRPAMIVNKGTGELERVPCNKCTHCKKRRVSHWSFRLMQEEKRSTSAHFITITYDTRYLPFTKSGVPTLYKRDLQKFFKRVRKKAGRGVKYYAVGEYGGRTKRPHYHAIVFNVGPSELINSWSKYNRKKKIYSSMGNVHFGTCTWASVGYTLGYITKTRRHKRTDTRQRTFAVMSKGLGSNYLTQKMHNWHKADLVNRMYCNVDGGKKISMPRYYRQRLYDEIELEKVKAKLQDDFVYKLLKELDEATMGAKYIHKQKTKVVGDFLRREKQLQELGVL